MNLPFETVLSALSGHSGLLASMAARSLVILAFVGIVAALWRRGAAAVRHLIYTTTFLCLLCLPVFMQMIPVWHPPVWIASASLGNHALDSASYLSPGSIVPAPAFSPTVSKSLGAALVSARGPVPAVLAHPPVNWGGIAVAVWLTGILLGGLRWLAGRFQLHRWERQWEVCRDPAWLNWVEKLRSEYRIRRRVRLLVAQAAMTPVTWGVWRPVVVLPAEARSWTPARLQVVLRHEMAHVARWDCLTQELARTTCLLYWFNPLVWLAASSMRAEREKACDDMVLHDGARPSEYAGHLVEIARQSVFRHAFSGAVAMARPSGLQQRVSAILDGRRNRNRIARMTMVSIITAVFSLGLLVGSYAAERPSPAWSLEKSKVAGPLQRFIAEKEKQAGTLFAADKAELAKNPDTAGQKFAVPDYQPFFAAAAQGDWLTVSNLWTAMEARVWNQNDTNNFPHGMWLQPLREVYGAVDAFATGAGKYSEMFGDDIIQSLPPGSIYFGGTDPGRFIVTAMKKSPVAGEPFFILTQNALADRTYLDYLHSMYGEKIYIPTPEDSQNCFTDYVQDATKRLRDHQLKPGEDVQGADGRLQVRGLVAVMQINGLLAKKIFDENPGHEYYIEESWPLDWMYPNLEPHGLIFKINRAPLTGLSDAMVQADRDYWQKLIPDMIGDWLSDGTSVGDVTTFGKKVFLQHDLTGFTGDPGFVQNEYATKMFSKLRASTAGLYAWRAEHATTDGEKERMARAADFAFRQALALCPFSPDVTKPYAAFLTAQHREADAQHVLALPPKFDPKLTGLPTPAVLQMRLVLDSPSADSEPMRIISSGSTAGARATEMFDVQKTVLMDQTALKSAKVVKGRLGEPLIDITLTDAGRTQFATITREHLHQRLAMILDGKLWSAPTIASEITGGKAAISGNFTAEEAEALTAKINEAVGK